MLRWAVHLRDKEGGTKTVNRVAVNVRHCVYCFGGDHRDKEKQINVHVFNTMTLIWRTLTPERGEQNLEVPTRRYGHTAVLVEEAVYLWGGCKSWNPDSYCNVLYAFDVDTHTWCEPDVSGTLPEGRSGHSACVLRKVIFIHGGSAPLTDYTNDTYRLDTITMVWTLIHPRGTEPPDSQFHTAAVIGTKMFVFVGSEPGLCHQTIRVLDTETNLWMDTPSAQLGPEGCDCHSVFIYNGEMYIFEGIHDGFYSDDLWKFSPETFSWKKVEPKGKGPPPTHGMCCCMVGDRVIFLGGYHNPYDLYILDLSPSLKTLCKLVVIQYDLDRSGLPHDLRWELAAVEYK